MATTPIKDCWRIIQRQDPKLLVAGYKPLAHIGEFLSYFDLPPLPPTIDSTSALADIASVEPSFQNLTDNITYSLRHQIYSQAKLDVVEKWTEKLMRFCEVRYAALKRRSMAKFETLADARLHLLHLASLFMDQSIAANDLRYLNTVLKLVDLRWLLREGTLRRRLTEANSGTTLALFEFRIHLTTEYALGHLSRELA